MDAAATGATMAKYKSKSQPPFFLLSFRPRVPLRHLYLPLSSISREPPTSNDALSLLVVYVYGLYPRPRISLPLFRTPPGLSFALPTSLYRSLYMSPSSALILPSLRGGFLYFSDHFGFYSRTSRSNKIIDDTSNRK